uniref:Cytochrome P450 n=1 Tax=Chenopodium quinoa TaxID=63459 RepID=A0A803KYZ2_CHEQI
MEYYIIVTLLLTIVYITFIYKTFSKSKVINPPGPRPWPIIGNMLLLDDKPHRVVAKLSRIYGPIMSLKLGSLTTIVISSPEIAKEMFVKHDLDFSSRIVQDAVRALNHEKVSLVWLPVSPKWREIRKILALQLFTTHRLNESQDIRHKKVKELVDYVQQCCEAGQAVDIGKAGFTTVLNLLSNTFFSMDFASHSSSGLQEFKELVRHFMEEIGRPNVSDFFPLIRWLDLQGVLKRSRRNYTKSLDIFQKIIDERLRDPNAPKDDVLATLLKLIKDNNLSLDEVKHLLVPSYKAKKVNELVEYVQQRCEGSLPVDIGKAGNTTSLNLLSNTFFSIDLASHTDSNSQEFRDLTRNIVEDAARPNVSDLFPIVRRLDIQGVLKRHTIYFGKLMRIFEKFIDERLKNPMDVKDDVLGTLLKLVENNELSLDEVKHMLVDLFIAGTDTTSITLEWAMTELLRNPTKMEKAKSELDEVLGKKGSMQESYISNLPYIQAILKETLRLHPPAPLLIPHKAVKDVQLGDYLVQKNSTLWVSVWWISHDPSIWPNPECFLPERFLEKEIDAKKQDFEFIPFGAGRRMCPGILLAYRMLHLMLATLIHSFNWKKGHGELLEDLDMEEKFGMTLQKAHPLEAIPFIR